MDAFPVTFTGIDLIETERIRRILERQGDAFLTRVFTDTEREYCQAHGRPELPLAARWAAKEAVAKAFGTGIGEHASFREIEVIKLPGGQPAIRLHGSAAETATRLGVREIQVSLTHTENYAAAVVVMVRSAPAAPVQPSPAQGQETQGDHQIHQQGERSDHPERGQS